MSAPLTRLDEVVAPSRCALLVIDVQNDFVHPEGWSARHAPGGPSLRHVIPVINDLIAGARRAALPVVYVVMEHGPEVDAPNYQARYVARGMEDDILCRAGSWGARLDDALTPPAIGAPIIRRHSYDGFARTELDRWLRRRGVETVVATGVVTNLCVQTTVHHAFSLGYYTAIVRDGTAAASKAEHEHALDLFRRFFGPTPMAAEILSLWAASAKTRAAPEPISGDASRNG
jgi:ureidoacrylate peracid hydrolase